MAVIEDLKRFLIAVNANSGTDQRHDPPADPAAIDSCEIAIGFGLPRSLRGVYEFANGGLTLSPYHWFGVERLPELHLEHIEFVDEERDLFGREPLPTAPWVCFQATRPWVVVVECGGDGKGGRVWWYVADGSDPSWKEAAPSLEAFVAAHADLAEVGLIEAEPYFAGTGYVIDHIRGADSVGFETPPGKSILERHQVTLIPQS